MGVGFRQMNIDWNETYKSKGKNKTRSRYKTKAMGPTARGRIGYRIVGERFPIHFAVYVGIRHYENDVDDGESTTIPKEERNGLENRFKTSFEPGLEVGLAF